MSTFEGTSCDETRWHPPPPLPPLLSYPHFFTRYHQLSFVHSCRGVASYKNALWVRHAIFLMTRLQVSVITTHLAWSVHGNGWPLGLEDSKQCVNFAVILTDQIPVLWCTLSAFLAVDMRTRSASQQATEESVVKAVYWMSFQQREIQWHPFVPRTVLLHLLRCGFQGTGLPKNRNGFNWS